jgi:hypothetical protein
MSIVYMYRVENEKQGQDRRLLQDGPISKGNFPNVLQVPIFIRRRFLVQ